MGRFQRYSSDDPVTGTVKWFSEEKGFGFITPDGVESSRGNDVFVHYTAIETEHTGRRNLTPGMRVAFEVETDNGTGRRRAVNVVEIPE